MVSTTNLESNVSSLHENYFFKEFTYSNNTFYDTRGQEVELADNVIYLDGLTIIFQLKERSSKDFTNQEAEQKWFERKVLGKGIKQVKDTLVYLNQNTQIPLKNQQGDDFILSESSVTQIHKIIVYSASENLLDEYKYKKFHISKTAGVIHIFSIDVYREIIGILMTPAEVSEYFLFRETLIRKWGGLINSLPEGALIGQYFSEEHDKQPNRDFIKYIFAIDHKVEDWDVTGIIHSFKKRLTNFRS